MQKILREIELNFLVAEYCLIKKVSPSENLRVRSQLTSEMRQEFTRECLSKLMDSGLTRGVARQIISLCDLHHIIPTSLGGKNTPSNWALVVEYLHRPKLHNYIDNQTLWMERGEERLVLIPRHPEKFPVWYLPTCQYGVPIRIKKYSDWRPAA